jgi:outer membrane protein OmpA-like peptidoglycan-associated protein
MKTMIRKISVLSLLFLNFFLTPSLSQYLSNKVFIRAVQDADLFFYFNEDYEKAASLFEVLNKQYPGNSNIAAKLGICYLNIDGKKADALKLIIKASENIVKTDKEYLEYGQKAHLDTWFYLAHAYHVNDSLNKAISLYNDVKKRIGPTSAFRIEYIDNQIKACKYAIEMKKTPVKISNDLFVPWLIDFPGATNPVFSENDSVFIFTRKEGEKNHILCSYNNNGWQNPVDITSQLGGYDNLCSNSITAKGDLLVIYMDDGADGNLFTSSRKGSSWSRLKKLNKNINTKYWEAHGFISPDGKQLFFSSNRPDGYGELDIWVSYKESDGSWGPASNLGNTINTQFNDNSPFFEPVTSTLIFSSIGHNGMGGYDVFSSTFKDSKWTKPIGLPYPINTTSDNTLFTEDIEKKGFITSMVNDKTGIRNIYRIVLGELPSETIVANGSVGLQDGMNIVPGLAEIRLSHGDSSQLSEKIEINDNGKFKFNTRPGEYIVEIKYPGYKSDTFGLIIPKTFLGKSLTVNSSMIPEKVFSGDFLSIKNIFFDFDSFSLNDEALIDLENLKSVLNNYPELKIEVTGYTDIKGSREYNLGLADRRAQAVINYFASNGLSGSRFFREAAGAKDFIAINTNPDGTDNPEGRQYNRRVTLGIVNPQTGISIRQETYTPPGLREPHSLRYSIVLMKSQEKFYPDYFSDFKMDELFFVRPLIIDSTYFYILGEFKDKSDAESYLIFARNKGFNNCYVVNQYEIQTPHRQLIHESSSGKRIGITKIYTIQLRASKVPLNMDSFKLEEKVREIKGKDGYYRYIYGEFEGFSNAKAALIKVHNTGYGTAFIKEYVLLIKQ